MVEKAKKNNYSAIYFYNQWNPYGEFSNFYPAPIEIGGKIWPTSEHYFQAMKFEGKDREEFIRKLDSPGSAFKEARNLAYPLRSDWEVVKNDFMMTALRAKFTQHKNLLDVLLGTGEKKIVEHTNKDAYWADGGNGSGKNMLGILLMRLRDELRAKTTY